MASKYDIIIGIDPGITGGISILFKNGQVNVYPMPVKKKIINKKNKRVYDIKKIVDIISPFTSKKVLFVQEKVSSMPGEGSVSAFMFGKSSGLTIGAAVALKFEVVEVSPATWKREFTSLVTSDIITLKQSIKELKEIGKTLKDKQAKKENKKNVDKLSRQVKKLSKDMARNIISCKYPQLSHLLQKKNSDGVAESLLIALYGRENQDELVQKI